MAGPPPTHCNRSPGTPQVARSICRSARPAIVQSSPPPWYGRLQNRATSLAHPDPSNGGWGPRKTTNVLGSLNVILSPRGDRMSKNGRSHSERSRAKVVRDQNTVRNRRECCTRAAVLWAEELSRPAGFQNDLERHGFTIGSAGQIDGTHCTGLPGASC